MTFGRKPRAVLLCTAAVLVLLPLGAAADPVHLTTGRIFYAVGDYTLVDHVSGKGFTSTGPFGSDIDYYPPYSCFDCGGATITPSLSQSVAESPGPDGLFTAIVFTIDERQYLSSALNFTINAAHAILPADTTGNIAWTDTTFLFSGWIEGHPLPDPAGPLRRVDLKGSGTVRVGFSNNNWLMSDYLFLAPAPVPEPGTLLLFATGVLAILRRRFAKR